MAGLLILACGVADETDLPSISAASSTDMNQDGFDLGAIPSPLDPAPIALTLPSATQDTDWELYMLRLVNRARRDPAGEAGRIGSTVVESTTPPMPPLAYDLRVGEAAYNHTNWMHDNFGHIASGRAPDSFTHYETLDGQSTGAPAVGTPSFTGYRVGDRLVTVGYPWSSYGENISTSYATFDMPITRARIEGHHLGWWNSSGHRSNMLNATFTAFGFQIENRAFVPPRGGLGGSIDNLLFATQCFARPSGVRTHLFGLLYMDLDGDRAWTPRDVDDPLREGVMGVPFQIFPAGGVTAVASGVTFGNGAFSAPVDSGLYDVAFIDDRLPGGQLWVEDIAVASANVDLGDFELNATGPTPTPNPTPVPTPTPAATPTPTPTPTDQTDIPPPSPHSDPGGGEPTGSGSQGGAGLTADRIEESMGCGIGPRSSHTGVDLATVLIVLLPFLGLLRLQPKGSSRS